VSYPPVEPPAARVELPDASRANREGIVALSRTMTPGLVLQAYRKGIFPWPIMQGVVPWASPDPRAIFPLEPAGPWPRHVQRARREVENPLDAGGNDLIDDGLRMRRGDGDDGDIEPLTPRDALQLLDVVDRHAAARFVPDLLARRIEERGNLEAFLAEAGIVGEREAEVAGAEDGDAQAAVEAEDLTQVAAQLFHVIADAADTELTEVCEVLANLRGVEMELLGQALRGNRLHAGGVELVERAKVDREPVGRQFGDLIGRLPPLVRPTHKVQCYHHAPWHIRACSRP